MAIGSMNVSNNSKINNDIVELKNKDTELEDTLNTKANNDDIAIRSASSDFIQVTDAKDSNMILDHAPVNMLNITCTSQTVNGLTVTVNSNKTIYVTGTATATTYVVIGTFNVTPGQMFSFGQTKSVNGYPGVDGTSWNNYMWFKNHDGTTKWQADGIHIATVTRTINVELYVANGTTVDCTYYPRVYYENKRYAYVPPSGYEIASCGKNMYRCGDNIYTKNGLTITIKNGCITLNGTSTASVFLPYVSMFINGKLILSCLGGTDGIYWENNYSSYTTSESHTFIANKAVSIGLYVKSGITLDSVSIYPMIEIGDIATTYEPCKFNKITINNDTVFPITGLQSYDGITNVYNSYGVPMDVCYATNESGQTILNSISNINNKTGSTDISSIGDGTITGAIKTLQEKIDAL